MTDETAGGSDETVLAAQIEYYRAVAPEYLDGELDEPGADELVAAVEEHAPRGAVLELACGPGTWTSLLLQRASSVTAVDAAPEMLALARARVGADRERVRFVQADLFDWRPGQRYDGVFMGSGSRTCRGAGSPCSGSSSTGAWFRAEACCSWTTRTGPTTNSWRARRPRPSSDA